MKVDLQIIENVVCNHYELSVKELFGKTRKTEIKEIRQIFQYLASKYSKETPKEIGIWSKRDRTTVLHSVKMVQILMETEKQFKLNVNEVESLILELISLYDNNDVYGRSFEIARDILSCQNKAELNIIIRKLTPVL